mgnify:FL=1
MPSSFFELGAAPGLEVVAGIFRKVSIVVGVVSFIAWIVQFFAMMRYIRTMAERIPDAYLVTRSKRYMWLLPLLQTVGLLLVGLGPLFALVMYWNLLDRLRKHLKAILRGEGSAQLKGMLDPAANL